jgi:transcriptional regulator with XRE-family HTH domain
VTRDEPDGLSHRVRELRRQRYMSQEELAHAAGVSRATIQKIENGRGQGASSLPKIARALGVEPAVLAGAAELIEATIVHDGEVLKIKGVREVVDAYVTGDDETRAALLALVKVLRRQAAGPN